MKTIHRTVNHHNGFLATRALGGMMYGYAHLASVKFEHSGCRGSLMVTYIHIYYPPCLVC